MNVLNVLARLVELEGVQADLLERVCSSETISADELAEAGATNLNPVSSANPADQKSLLD